MENRKLLGDEEFVEINKLIEEEYAFYHSEDNVITRTMDNCNILSELAPSIYRVHYDDDDYAETLFMECETSSYSGINQNADTLLKQDFIARKLIKMNVFAMKGEEVYGYYEPIWKKITNVRREVNYFAKKISAENNLVTGPKDIENIYKILDMSNNLYYVPDVNRDCICFTNGVYNIRTKKMEEFSQHYGFTSMVNVVFQPSQYADTTFFDAYCRNSFNGNECFIDLLLEIIGVTIMGTPLKAFFLFCGETNTGKSVMLDFLQEIIGLEHTENIPTLNYFSDKWCTGDIVDKKLCLCADNNNTLLEPDAISNIKQIASSDRVKVRIKYRSPYTDYVNPTIICASNYGLTIKNPKYEDALLKRLVVLPFFNTVAQENQILNLKDKLIKEASGIIAKSLEAYEKLEKRNFAFTEVIDKMIFINNPKGFLKSDVSRFIDVCWVKEQDNIITSDELYKAYVGLCLDISVEPIAKNAFSKEFNALTSFEKVDKVKGTVLRGYKGVALRKYTNVQ